MTTLVFDGYRPDDAALENSHWIAERTSELLGAGAVGLTYPNATRAALEAQIAAGGFEGVAVCGHGDPGRLHTTLRVQHHEPEDIRARIEEASEAGAVYGSDEEPALDVDNLHILQGRWCHAIACGVGLSLADRAVDAGASCFVAYETSLTPEYETETLPRPLRALLAALVTTTTANLHQGVRDATILKARMQQAIDALEGWLDGDEGAVWIDSQGYMQVAGLRGLARQLKRDMVVRGVER